MKTISIAPTWAWTMGMALRLIEDGNQRKAENGFIEEVERLGPDVKLLIKEFRKEKTREAARGFLMEKARRVDESISRREKDEKKKNKT